jgi:putative DNA primase/helicase
MPQENTELLSNTVSLKNHKKPEGLRLTDKHYTECVTKRGLAPEWIAVNCHSMTIKDATARLGYAAKSAGIWLEGVNGFGQFRPNKPWKNPEHKKAPKYRTATAEKYDAMLPRHPHNPRYWDDFNALKQLCWSINGHPCLGLTEGLFKAIAGCSHDIPCVALAGVEQGLTPASDDVQGKRYLLTSPLAKAQRILNGCCYGG